MLQYIKGKLSPRAYAAAKRLVLTAGTAIGSVVLVLVLGYVAASPTFGWSGEDSTGVLFCVCVRACARVRVFGEGSFGDGLR